MTAALHSFLRGFGLRETERFAAELGTLDVAQRRVRGWFEKHLEGQLLPGDDAVARGRAAFFLSGAVVHAETLFLNEPLPSEWTEKLRAACPLPIPPVVPGKIAAQELVAPPVVAAIKQLLLTDLASPDPKVAD